MLITGVPGAGKDGTRLRVRATGHGRPGWQVRSAVRTLAIGTPALEDDAEMFVALASEMGGGKAALKAVGATRATTGVNLAVAGTGSGLSREGRLRSASEPGRHAAAHHARTPSANVEGQGARAGGGRAANGRREGHGGAADAARGLARLPHHAGGVGLQNTPSVLRRGGEGAGISRTSPPLTLSPLAAGEAEEATGQGLRKLGCRASDEAVRALGKASHGFPQHIHGYIRSAQKATKGMDISSTRPCGKRWSPATRRGRSTTKGAWATTCSSPCWPSSRNGPPGPA